MLRLLCYLLIAFCTFSTGVFGGTPIRLEPVEATTGPGSRFREAVDGNQLTANGWLVPQSEPHTGVFRCVPPMDAGRVRFWLTFYSGQKNTYFGEFSISATTAPNPSQGSRWEPIFPIAFNDNHGQMLRAHPHLRALNSTDLSNIRMDGVLPDDHVTGIRIESWPSPSGPTGTAILTELRVERTPLDTTNIALGCPASASHELPEKQYAEYLTDGLTGSYAHPASPSVGRDFYFEIDLRRVREIDHISLRSRSDNSGVNSFTHLHLQLFDRKPTADTPPVWSGKGRESAQIPEPGSVKVVRATDGEGVFRGRYLRIFSTSTFAYSPQIAEVEVYESIVAPGVGVLANDRPLPAGTPVRIPASTNWLNFALGRPQLRDGLSLGRRWRIVGARDEWLSASSNGVAETRGLPPGEYLFEAQLRHTDFEWNSASLRVPIIVLTPWWKNPMIQVAAALALAGVAALLAWRMTRQRLARQLAELERRQELSRERARIARNMHDVVGARLTQLTVMHEIVAAHDALPAKTRDQLQELTVTARAAVSALDEAVWAINPRNDKLQNVADYLCHAANDYLRPLGIACRQHVPDSWPAREVVSQKRHELFLAFKEALQNLVKHAGARLATLTLHFADPELIIWLDDDGRGLPPEVEGAGKDGLENMRTRLAGVGGSCVVQTRQEGGTRVEIRLPV